MPRYAPLEDDNGVVDWAGEDCIGQTALLVLLDLGRKFFQAVDDLYRPLLTTLSKYLFSVWRTSSFFPSLGSMVARI
jgi:hypothetical protein